ncbi:MAG: hypothetical protein AMJ54_06815 [Deltaproteobacteria bacterium SG8_13]|nr:MAG: hypothetical protein AMJ54_06815 [Deltaproteobacteria bacterium SG8_13]
MTVAFAVENTLGKLAKWLRILGFDATFDAGAGGLEFFRSASPHRVLLTRTASVEKQLRSGRMLFIHSNEPRQQLIEVLRNLEIRPEDVRPFTRCVACNRRIESVEKPSVRDKVPDFVYESHEQFRQCPCCGKIFWSGSHASRVMQRVRQLFDAAGPSSGEDVSPI